MKLKTTFFAAAIALSTYLNAAQDTSKVPRISVMNLCSGYVCENIQNLEKKLLSQGYRRDIKAQDNRQIEANIVQYSIEVEYRREISNGPGEHLILVFLEGTKSYDEEYDQTEVSLKKVEIVDEGVVPPNGGNGSSSTAG